MPLELPDKFAALAPWFEQYRRMCWLPQVRPGDGRGPTASRFGGSPWLADGEPWPACGNCEGPMSLFLQLDLATVPEPARPRFGPGVLQAFFCTASDCVHGPDEGQPFTDTHVLRVIDPAATKGNRRPPRARRGRSTSSCHRSRSSAGTRSTTTRAWPRPRNWARDMTTTG